MAGVTGPIDTLPGAVRSVPENTECDDCNRALCNRLQEESQTKHGDTFVFWADDTELKARYEIENAKLPRATKRMQGETDSFGSEQHDLCEACYQKNREAIKAYRAEPDQCDWCKQTKPNLSPTRDYDEGMCGPVYEVCQECNAKRTDAIMREQMEYSARHDHDRYDD